MVDLCRAPGKGPPAILRRLSIGRAFRLALLGLTVTLAGLSAIGLAQLYHSRQQYEDRLESAYAVEASAGKLLAAGVVEEATLRTAPRGSAGRAARRRAERAFTATAALAADLARDDGSSRRLVAATVAAQRRLREAGARSGALRARTNIARLSARQGARRADARHDASSASRRAIAILVGFGLLAVLLTLALVGAILAAGRRPLASIVQASGRLAAGDLSARVDEDGPRDLAPLAAAFNAMAFDLAQAQELLGAERERLSTTIESLADGVVEVDDGDRIYALNPRAREMLPDANVGVRFRDISGWPDPVDALAGEVVVERGTRTLAVTASRLGFAGRALVWTVRDVSERVRLDRLKSEFVATASHELRSPLTSIKGFVELLNASKGMSAKQREWVEIILVSTDRLVDLVNDLLDVARVEAGRVEIHRRPTDVTEAVEEVALLLGARLSERDQELVLELDEGLPRAMADPSRVRQVLTNLLTNAHQYTADGGRLTVRATSTRHAVVIEVADTGRGMTEEQVEHVFERFYRGADGPAEPGTGLGLAIVRSLIDLQGGSIDVTSAPGVGTTFTIRLPRVADTGTPDEPRTALQGKRVLVLDDEPEIAALIAERLRPFGVHTTITHDGPTALAALRGEAFDAMTLDILMPGMSGFEVLRTLRADERLSAMPVVVVSVFSGREALSGEWVVPKPIDSGELADALGAAVMAGRVRVLVVGRPDSRGPVTDALGDLGIEFEWAAGREAARRLTESRHFEVALVDAGLPDPESILSALDLRGRRLRRSVVVFSADGVAAGFAKLDAEPVALEDAGAAVLALLEGPSWTEDPD